MTSDRKILPQARPVRRVALLCGISLLLWAVIPSSWATRQAEGSSSPAASSAAVGAPLQQAPKEPQEPPPPATSDAVREDASQAPGEASAGETPAGAWRSPPWELRRRDAAPLISRAFWEELPTTPAHTLRHGWRELTRLGGQELPPGYPWLLVLQILTTGALALGIKQLARQEPAAEGREAALGSSSGEALALDSREWRYVLRHPWSASLFVATGLVGGLYAPAPAAVALAVWTFLAGSGLILARGLLENRRQRRAFYLLAIFHPLTLMALEILPDGPRPRLYVAATAALALGLLLLGVLREGRSPSPQSGFLLALRLGAGVAAGSVVAELLGFASVAVWLLKGALGSAFLAFAVTFLLRLGVGGTQYLVVWVERRPVPLLQRMARPLGRRLSRLLRVLLLAFAVLFLLYLWDLTPSPWRALREVAAWPLGAGSLRTTVGGALFGALAIYLSFNASWLVRETFDARVETLEHLDDGLASSLKTLLHYAILLLGLVLALGLAGFSLSNFAILAGALGVGVGFGLQNLVNNFASGLILLFERPVRPGDVVVVGGEWGTVQKIGLRSTIIVTFDRAEMIVPNGDLISEKVTNWTLSDRVARIVLPVGVAYGSDVPKVLKILMSLVEEHPEIVAEPAPQALFRGFGESSLDFELRVWVRSIDARLEVTSVLCAALEERFRREGVEIPFPQRDLHLRSVAPEASSRLRADGDPAGPKDHGSDRAP